MDATSYGFSVEWYDKQADIMRQYTLTVFEPVKGNLEVAIYDPKTHRAFLKRCEMAHLTLHDFHLGHTVTIHSRQLKITTYNDERTKATLGELHDIVTLATAPSFFPHVGDLLSRLDGIGLRLTRLRIVNNSGPVLVVQATGQDATGRWGSIAGQMPPGAVRMEEEDCQLFDTNRYPTTAAFDNCALCLIRPHVVKEGGVGLVFSAIMEAGLEISAVEMLHMRREEAVEFLEVYKGVLPYYSDMVDGTSAGLSIAIEVRGPGGVVERLREVCGPHDVDMARHLRPGSLRARLGRDNANNGVHATDLDEDAEREVSYIFDTLMRK